MKDQRVQWELILNLKSTCNDVDDPPTKLRFARTGAWNPSKVGALECLARDLAELLRVAGEATVPSCRRDIINAFADELTANWPRDGLADESKCKTCNKRTNCPLDDEALMDARLAGVVPKPCGEGSGES